MLVSQILKQKPQGVITAAPDMKLADVVALLSAKKIGAVVISANCKTVQGIVSERDIVRVLGHKGPAVLDAAAREIMTAKVITCTAYDRADDVLQKMTDGRFRHLPVLEDGALIGLISIGDVVKARLSELHMEKDALEGMIKGH